MTERETLVGSFLYAPRLGSNPQPFGVWDGVLTNRASQRGLDHAFNGCISQNSPEKRFIAFCISVLGLPQQNPADWVT